MIICFLLAHVAPAQTISSAASTDAQSAKIDGNAHQLLNQATGLVIAWVLAIVGTLIILKTVDVTLGLRVSEEHEMQGVDLSQHGEEGYYWESPA